MKAKDDFVGNYFDGGILIVPNKEEMDRMVNRMAILLLLILFLWLILVSVDSGVGGNSLSFIP
jgi:hypothetical protein